MKLPFYYRLTATTLLSAAELREHLRQRTLTEGGQSAKDQALIRAVLASGADTLYVTLFTEAGFELQQGNRKYHFKPGGYALCRATLLPYGTGCRVRLVSKAPLFIRLFMYFWASGATFGLSSIFFGNLAQGNVADALPLPLVAGPFVLGFWLIHYAGFGRDTNAALAFLREVGQLNRKW